MRVGIVSDIHSNLPALSAVLEDMGQVDQLWCLGDSLGYGRYPNEVVDILRQRNCQAIPGNHDLGRLGNIPLEDFNSDAQQACEWTQTVLSPENRHYLESLPLTLTIGDFTLVHGTPQEPIWEYMAYPSNATLAFQYFSGRYCLVGHTHVPLVFLNQGGQGPETVIPTSAAPVQLSSTRAILNPGSVGQPRDGNPAAAYAIYNSDSNQMEFRRAGYDVARIQADMQALDFPPRLIKRLTYGW